MKRFFWLAFGLTMTLAAWAQEPVVEIRRMTQETLKGNQRYPAVAENRDGERIYTFRGGDGHAHYFHYKDGTWSGGGQVPNSPKFGKYWFSDIVTDSQGTFHYVCEDAGKALYYAYFKNGAWTAMKKLGIRHEASLALGVRSDDTVVLVSTFVTNSGGLTKDVIVGTKDVRSTQFSRFANITKDRNSNTMVDVAIDADDNTWISYKEEFPQETRDILDTILHGLDKANKDIFWKNVSDQTGWTWYSKVAVNSDGKIMVTWMRSQLRAYFSRLYDPAANQWSEEGQISPGPLRPWCSMYNKLLARGSDFYWVGLDGDRFVVLYKYNPENNSWAFVADISNGPATWCSARMGAESLLICWDSFSEPTACYLATVSGIFPPPPIKVQSVSNLAVERKVERSFFRGYSFNVLTWEANPINTEEEITISAHRVYRKERTADSSQWAQIVVLGADVYTFLDKNVPSESDYVYAVTCVDSEGNESPLEEPTGQGTEASAVGGGRVSASRSSLR